MAAALLKAGIPAVVAMQFTIQDKLAAAFDAAFYRALVAGFTVDEAVALGRAAIRVEAAGSAVRDWGVPVLYLRAPGGRVFNPVSDEAARRQAEEQSEHIFQQHARILAPSGRMIGPMIGTVKGEAVTVEQVVDERASGTMFGGYFFSVQGGRLVVRQKADVLDGTMIGPAVARLGGAPASVAEEHQALARIEELLGIVRPPAPQPAIFGPTGPQPPFGGQPAKGCPSCGGPVESGAKFCPNCGKPLTAGPKFCAQCGAELMAGAKFCIQCGAPAR